MASISVFEARAALPAVLDRVTAGEEVALTRHGVPVAVVMRPDLVRVRRAERALAEAAAIGDLRERSRRTPLDHQPRLSERRGEELIREIRRGRADRAR